jgi:hypothetical protein
MAYTPNSFPIRPWIAIAAFLIFYQLLLPRFPAQSWQHFFLLLGVSLLITLLAGTYWGWGIGAAYIWIAFLAVSLWNYILVGSAYGWDARLFAVGRGLAVFYTPAYDSVVAGLGGVIGQVLLLLISRFLRRFHRLDGTASAATRDEFDQYFR